MLPTPYPREPGVRKIAVLRANGLGDFVFALPALAALRSAYPEAEIVLLGQPWHARFLAGRPSPVDRVVVVPPSRGIYEPAGAAPGPEAHPGFFDAMRRESFDLALQMHGSGRISNPFVLRLGARLTAGLRDAQAPPLDRWVPYVFYQPEVVRYLEVAALVGAAAVGLEPRLAVTEADLAESRRLVPGDGRPLAVLHPGATDPRRRWPPERFAAVGDVLAAAGARVVVTGTAAEADLVRAVTAAMAREAVDAAGRLSLGGLAGLLARCAVVVANDTGPLHLALAVGAAAVGVYWCGNVITAAPPTRWRHRPVISWRLACPACGLDCTRARCGHRDSFVADVPVAEVVDQALDLLRREGGLGERS